MKNLKMYEADDKMITLIKDEIKKVFMMTGFFNLFEIH